MSESTFSGRAPTEGIYRRVSVRMWGDARFLRLSALQPSGQALWVFLLTGPHTTAIPGVFVIGRAALAEALEWDDEAFAKAFDEVVGQGLVEFDLKSRMWFIPRAIRHNMPANPNVVKSWRAAIALLPECEMRDRVLGHLKAELFSLSEAFGKAFEEACAKPSAKPFVKASAKGSPKQEQKQEQEKKPPKPPRGAAKVDPRFAQFWAAYPRRVDKVAAARAFGKLTVSEDLLATMLAAIRRQQASDQWRKDGGKFVPYPATWLNGRRWQDEEVGGTRVIDEARPDWAVRAGFANRFEAENAGCFERNHGAFANGRRLERAPC